MILPKQLYDLYFAAFLDFGNVQFLRAPDHWYYLLLAHDSFQKSDELWVSGVIDSKDYMIPFHLPHKKCVAGKHRSLRDVIYNYCFG